MNTTVKTREKNAYTTMKDSFGYTNTMQAPHFVKIVVSAATGTKMKRDRTANDLVMDRIGKITGQKPSIRSAKQSVASFKIRTGDPIGVAVTLRGAQMYSFLDKLFDIALPRTKDFQGVKASAIDSIGNMTIGIKEHTIFPETGDEDVRDIFGFAITLVTTAKTKEEAKEFFTLVGVPFRKDGK